MPASLRAGMFSVFVKLSPIFVVLISIAVVLFSIAVVLIAIAIRLSSTSVKSISIYGGLMSILVVVLPADEEVFTGIGFCFVSHEIRPSFLLIV